MGESEKSAVFTYDQTQLSMFFWPYRQCNYDKSV